MKFDENATESWYLLVTIMVVIKIRRLTDKSSCDDADATKDRHNGQPNSNVRHSPWYWSSVINQEFPGIQTQLENVVDLEITQILLIISLHTIILVVIPRRIAEPEEKRLRRGCKNYERIFQHNFDWHSNLTLTRIAKPFPGIHETAPSCAMASACSPSSTDCMFWAQSHRLASAG